MTDMSDAKAFGQALAEGGPEQNERSQKVYVELLETLDEATSDGWLRYPTALVVLAAIFQVIATEANVSPVAAIGYIWANQKPREAA